MPEPIEIVVYDRDGTLASVEWVRPNDQHSSSWYRYNVGMPFDAVVPMVEAMLRRDAETRPCFMFSGRAQGDRRGETFRYWQMWAWIRKHDLPIDRLLMREAGDQRADSIVKNEFVEQVEAEGYRIVKAVDDRPQVCDGVWRARGIPLVQVVDPGLPPLLLR